MANQVQLITKTFGAEIVRFTNDDDQLLFVAKDVCETLGYKNPRQAVSTHCKGVQKLDTPTPSGTQKVTFIPESDVYRLVMGSKLPDAEKFKDWVCSEVLPTIRKTGAYEQGEKQEMAMTGDPIMDMLNAMMAQRQEVLGIAKKQTEIDERLVAIEAGSIPAGWNTIGEISRMAGISKNKTLEIIAAFNVSKKRIPQSGEQRITHVTIASESEFFDAFEKVKSESEKLPGSDFYRHDVLGRFQIKEAVKHA